ncbi:uncharacterized protein BCR38DRAFT_450215 [Pseudomassariella vexata]|uniref:Uncharacterized protein n=1 Tax=Pseudomassariella vexata TaxID=1141098 RepID=A0A1Y2DCI1_9PEZI|nr:uncharacterized protein BCR38DRAFT_450215 [Pseudomassariella vexata]ORY56854.1 hypothetical protein BCR38DRAFT_450215 [Pseudomassariella vexata]
MEKSPNAYMWENRHSGALGRLKRRLAYLQQSLNEQELMIMWMRERLAAEAQFHRNRTTGSTPEDMPDRINWKQPVDELVETFTRLGFRTQEKYIIAKERKDTLQKDIHSSEKEWEKWKYNNCGGVSDPSLVFFSSVNSFPFHHPSQQLTLKNPGTSCYDTFSTDSLLLGNTQKLYQGLDLSTKLGIHDRANPKRFRAHKAVSSSQGEPDISYEKICCGRSMDNEWAECLKYGSKLVYQHPLQGHKSIAKEIESAEARRQAVPEIAASKA